MTTYTLFRDGQPIAQDEMKAGDLHDIGRLGDFILATDPGDPPLLLAWCPYDIEGCYWRSKDIGAITAEMQLKLLLLQGTLPTGKALLARQIVPIP